LTSGASGFELDDRALDFPAEQTTNSREGFPMDMNEIHDYARRLLEAHGDQAEKEAAQKAVECEQGGDKSQAYDWRRIQAAISTMRGPLAS
jgi:hypothetical protein